MVCPSGLMRVCVLIRTGQAESYVNAELYVKHTMANDRRFNPITYAYSVDLGGTGKESGIS